MREIKRQTNKKSEIINTKKQLLLKIDQTSDFVYPNELYKYQIYCKNISGDIVENVRLQVLNPSVISINEDDEIPTQGIEIGDLKDGQSHLLYLTARANAIGEFTVHFLCFGEGSELITKKLTISCNYDAYSNKTIHKIHIYNFTPYEEKYELLSKNYNENVTQLIKRQKLPYGAKQSIFKAKSNDENKGIIIDESQSYIDSNNLLYGDQQNTDEHNYQHLERENFNKESVENFEGENLIEILDNINKYSKFFKATFLRTGTNELLNDFKQYNPNGFIYRFGLMNSEIFHHLGVLPTFTYMNDYLFRWAAEGKLPLSLYPKRIDMNWDMNKWTGHGWNVWKTYTDEYKEQIINSDDFKPLLEFVHTFETLETAEEYIKNEYNHDLSNEYYIHTEEGILKIRKYQYLIKESYFDNGVFFVNIPLNKIPSNFFLLETDDIEAIIEKTKPYGMKALIRYVIDTRFNINMSFKGYCEIHPHIPLDFGETSKIGYSIIPYQYNNVIETICYKDGETPKYEERNSLKLIPCGKAYYNAFRINIDTNINIPEPEPTSRSIADMEPEIQNQMYGCQTDTDLTTLSQVQDLLYKGNFDDISFYIQDIPVNNITSTQTDVFFDKISAIDYKLWIDCLSTNRQILKENEQLDLDQHKQQTDAHSHWWSITVPNESTSPNTKYIKNAYYFSDIVKLREDQNFNASYGKIDFLEIPLTNQQIIKNGIESGIGFEDENGKLHGLSSEYNEKFELFNIKYATSLNNNFKIKKEGLANIIGLAYKFEYNGNNTIVTFFIKQKVDDHIRYNYFDHIIVKKINAIFCFTRNNQDISTIRKWSNIIKIGKKSNPNVTFNTPQYYNLNLYNPNIILNKEITNWTNIQRIDKNEQSYAVIHNNDIDSISVKNIDLHFDDLNLPDDAIVKNIKLKTIMETNSYKNIYPSIRLQDGFITENSNVNNISLYPANLECYPYYNNNTKYYQDHYNEAVINDTTKSIQLFKSKIEENEIFNESLDYNLDYLDNIDNYITVKKPFWLEISDFTDYHISMNNINEIIFCIEGYNNGKEIDLVAQLKKDNTFSEKSRTLIPSGYFKKYIPLKFYNSFFIDDIELRFRFISLNTDLYIFDNYLEVFFNEKQNENKEFIESEGIDIENKKIIEADLIKSEIPAYILNDALTTKIRFDDLDVGEYYRIYSMELEVVYEKQNTDFIISSDSQFLDYKNELTVVSGKAKNEYMSGMFINEVIMPGTYQPLSTLNSENQGIELKDAIYQCFTATTTNITSFTVFPNGFVGSPDMNLKIGLYENKGNTPNRLIKEIRASGWSKENTKLKNATIITYDFNVNNLIIGKKYWIKIEVENPSDNNYYLLKYSDTTQNDLELLTRLNNNLINTFGSLKFYVNTLNSFRSFNSLPTSEDNLDFSDPKIFIGLNKRIGELKNIKIQKIGESNDNANT